MLFCMLHCPKPVLAKQWSGKLLTNLVCHGLRGSLLIRQMSGTARLAGVRDLFREKRNGRVRFRVVARFWGLATRRACVQQQ